MLGPPPQLGGCTPAREPRGAPPRQFSAICLQPFLNFRAYLHTLQLPWIRLKNFGGARAPRAHRRARAWGGWRCNNVFSHFITFGVVLKLTFLVRECHHIQIIELILQDLEYYSRVGQSSRPLRKMLSHLHHYTALFSNRIWNTEVVMRQLPELFAQKVKVKRKFKKRRTT